MPSVHANERLPKRRIHRIPLIWMCKFLQSFLKLTRGGHYEKTMTKVVNRFGAKTLPNILNSLQYGTVLIVNTGDKTSVSHILGELFKGQGLKVFRSALKSPTTKSLQFEMLCNATIFGKFRMNIALLELSEENAVECIELLKGKFAPNIALIANTLRETAQDNSNRMDIKMLEKIASAIKGTLILNVDNSEIANFEDIAKDIGKGNAKIAYFGLSPKLKAILGDNAESSETKQMRAQTERHTERHVALEAPTSVYGIANANEKIAKEREITTFNDYVYYSATEDENFARAVYFVNGHRTIADLHLTNIYDAFNCAMALATVREVQHLEINGDTLIETLSKIKL